MHAFHVASPQERGLPRSCLPQSVRPVPVLSWFIRRLVGVVEAFLTPLSHSLPVCGTPRRPAFTMSRRWRRQIISQAVTPSRLRLFTSAPT